VEKTKIETPERKIKPISLPRVEKIHPNKKEIHIIPPDENHTNL